MANSLFERMSDQQRDPEAQPDYRAHARRTDPETSHEAAEAITPDLRELQRIVDEYARERGPEGFVDAQMEHDLADRGSTFRTRRHELHDRNIILDSGKRRTWGDSPRQRIVWVHRNFVAQPPMIIDPPEPATAQDRKDALVMTGKLASGARQMRSEGRAAFADELERAAALMRKLAHGR